MHRDMELIRKIVLAIRCHEGRPSTSDIAQEIEGVPADQQTNKYDVSDHFGYQMEQLWDQGFIQGADARCRGTPYQFIRLTLTWAGNDFADTIANDSIWTKTKNFLADKEIQSATLSVWAQVASQQLAKTLGLN